MQKMKIKIQVLEKPDKNWDKRVIENNGDIYQTTTYAKFQEKCLNMESEFLLAIKDSKIVGQLVVTYGPRFAKYLNKRKRWFDFFSKYFKIYTFIRGPIIINKKLKKEAYSSFLDYFDNNKKNCFMAQDISLPIEEEEPIYKLFYKKGFYSDSWGTVIIDTSVKEEILWKKIGKKRRNLVRKGEKLGLEFQEAKTKEDYKKIVFVIKEMARRNNIFHHLKRYYDNFFKIFKKDKRIRTFFAKKEGKMMATLTLYLFGDQVTQTAVAHSDYSAREKIPSMDFLEWHIIKWCHDNGYGTYDFAGIRPDSKEKKEEGLRHYKTKWGGEEMHYPYFSKNYSIPKKFLINLLIGFGKRKLVTK